MTANRHAIFAINDSANSRGSNTGDANTDVRNSHIRQVPNSSLVRSSPVHKRPEQEWGKRLPTRPPPSVGRATLRQTQRPP